MTAEWGDPLVVVLPTMGYAGRREVKNGIQRQRQTSPMPGREGEGNRVLSDVRTGKSRARENERESERERMK